MGLGIRVDFPYIKNFRELSKYVVVSSANLYLYPIARSYDDNTYLPTSLSVAEINKANNFISSYYDDEATLYIDDEFHEITTYHISLQEYIHGLVFQSIFIPAFSF